MNGKLIGKRVEENLYLAYLHLAHKNDEEAFALLSQTLAGKPLGYGEKEDKIIEWMEKHIEAFGANTPQAKALQLKLLYLKVRNQAPNKDNNFSSALAANICAALVDYYPVSQHAVILTLTRAEELELLKFAGQILNSFSELLSIRKEQLEKTAEEMTHQWLGEPKINAYESTIKIPSSIDFAKINNKALNKKILELQTKDMPKPVFFLDGEKKLADEFPSVLELACSENEQDRKNVLSKITLLKLSDKSELYPVPKCCCCLLPKAHQKCGRP